MPFGYAFLLFVWGSVGIQRGSDLRLSGLDFGFEWGSFGV